MTVWTLLVCGIATLGSGLSVLIGNPWALPMTVSFGSATIVAEIEGVWNGE
jgi:hypothetical protein